MGVEVLIGRGRSSRPGSRGGEVGGGVFPLSAYLSPFPATDEAGERDLAEKAAYEDALAEAEAWITPNFPADQDDTAPR